MNDKTVALVVSVKDEDQMRELVTMFSSILYTLDHDPSIKPVWMSMAVGNKEHADPWTHTFIGKLTPEELYYDDQTLNKVREAIAKQGLWPASIDELINAIQNAGILFRERMPEDDTETSS